MAHIFSSYLYITIINSSNSITTISFKALTLHGPSGRNLGSFPYNVLECAEVSDMREEFYSSHKFFFCLLHQIFI